MEKVHEQQAKDDFYLMSELVRDYVGIVGSVREAFQVGKIAPILITVYKLFLH